jgi:CubicO group peptidase (beta-lactamase class C family)
LLKPATQPAAIAPVDAAGMQAVLDRDFEAALKSGVLASQTATGVTIGVVRHDVRRVFSYGTAHTDSIFEIGSVSKTFTGLILARLVVYGSVRLDTPVRELLPVGTVVKPAGREITLLDLVTQHSGLPSWPDNLHQADITNPFADYRPADLYQYIAQHGVGAARGCSVPLQQPRLRAPRPGARQPRRQDLRPAAAAGDHRTPGAAGHRGHPERRAARTAYPGTQRRPS